MVKHKKKIEFFSLTFWMLNYKQVYHHKASNHHAFQERANDVFGVHDGLL